MEHRTIVVGLVWNSAGDLLFCRMDPQKGVYPGDWGFPGGGIEPGERMEDALRRELREELGIEIADIRPAFFKDTTHAKRYADGSSQLVYMIFLCFYCKASSENIQLNKEFVEYRWVSEDDLNQLQLNAETIDTLGKIGSWRNARHSLTNSQ
jgi:nucleoside triphosphatase